MNEIKWGIIGCGNVTEVKSGPAFNLVEKSKLVAVMRRNEEKAKDYAQRHGVARWYGDAEKLINDPEVNAVYVATPPDTHAEYAIRAMQAGKPAYVEKPMALNFRECEKMIEVSEKSGVPLFVAYYRRALPGFLKVRELIERNQVGAVQHVTIQLYKPPSSEEKRGENGWRVNPEISGAGHFFDLASHQLDYLDYLFGPVAAVQSVVKNLAGLYKAEDYVSANFTFESGIVCSGTWNFACSEESKRDFIEIIGDKGRIEFSTFGFEPIRLINLNGIQKFNFPRPDHVQYYLIKEIVAELTGNGKSPSTGHTAARTSRILDEVVKDYYS